MLIVIEVSTPLADGFWMLAMKKTRTAPCETDLVIGILIITGVASEADEDLYIIHYKRVSDMSVLPGSSRQSIDCEFAEADRPSPRSRGNALLKPL